MLALALGGFGIGTTEFVAMGLLPEMASGLGVSEPVAGHVISAYALGVVVGAPLIAALTARVPRRTLLIALMVAFTVGNALNFFVGRCLLRISRCDNSHRDGRNAKRNPTLNGLNLHDIMLPSICNWEP